MTDSPDDLEMSARFPSTAIQRDYDNVRTSAYQGPVVVTRHGRDDLVVMTLDHYRAIAEQPRAYYAGEAPAHVLEMIGTQRMAPEHAEFDDEVENESSAN